MPIIAKKDTTSELAGLSSVSNYPFFVLNFKQESYKYQLFVVF